MYLRNFSVQGYKNFRRRVELNNLPSIVVIHGDNNVGKSNLLEAMSLFFCLLADHEGEGRPLPLWRAVELTADHFAQATRLQPREIFNAWQPEAIVLEGTIDVSHESLRAAGIVPLLDTSNVEIVLRVQPHALGVSWKVDRFRFAGEEDAVTLGDGERSVFVRRFALYLARNYIAGRSDFGNRFEILTVHRELSSRSGTSPNGTERLLVSTDLQLRLYDAKESLEPTLYERWSLFASILASFDDLLGPGQVVVTYDRSNRTAQLAWQSKGQRIPVQWMGSGVQQLVGLVAHLLVSGASILGIEEPELNLRFTQQLRLREILGTIVNDGRGPSQLFITSHSPAFESDSSFYHVVSGPDGPTVSVKSPEHAEMATGHRAERDPGRNTGTLSYVSSEGVVMLPHHVREAIGVAGGGGVVFVMDRNEKAATMMTNDTYLQRHNLPCGGENEDDA